MADRRVYAMIVINGMEMPKNCNYCRFNYDKVCHAAMQSFYEHKVEKNGKLKDCPLSEVNVGLFQEPAIGSDEVSSGGNNETLFVSCNKT